jgi:hypothetical protein
MPDQSHGAEADCITLIRTTAALGTGWIDWMKDNCYSIADSGFMGQVFHGIGFTWYSFLWVRFLMVRVFRVRSFRVRFCDC